MIRHKKKPCKRCEKEVYRRRKGMCDACYVWYWRNQKKQKAKILSQISGSTQCYTGEKQMYWDIWTVREHKSFISGTPLLDPNQAAWVSQFAHVIPKSKYPQIRFNPEYVVLLTVDEHFGWDNLTDDQRRKFYPYADWDKLEDLKKELIAKL